MKKGIYYIGDPCYPFPNEDHGLWLSFLNETPAFNGGGSCKISKLRDHTLSKEYELFLNSTYYGDGCYSDQEGFSYPVDAGLLSCIPLEFFKEIGMKAIKNEYWKDGLGKIVEFKEDFECSYEDGVFHFGHLVVDTKGSDGEEE